MFVPKLEFMSPNTTDFEFDPIGGICGLLFQAKNIGGKVLAYISEYGASDTKCNKKQQNQKHFIHVCQ